jgi:DNA polymerase I
MENTEKKLFLLDAYALIYRAFFAFSKNPRISSKGFNTSAIYGFTNTLFEIIRKEQPTHLGVCFDVSGPTERHIQFTEYKANRDEMPEDIRSAIPIIKDLLKNGFNIPVIGIEGFEADDVIGALAKMAEKDGYTTYMVTPDKDYGQLVSENIFMYKPAYKGNGFDIMGVPEICAKWDIEDPLTVIDILAMMGDTADNIPGIPGVGEKTAIKLLKEYGTLENILDNGDKIKGKLGEKIRDNKDQALMCKMLTTIILDIPGLTFDPKDLELGEKNNEKLSEIFNELEFRTLGKRILGSDFKEGTQEAIVSDAGTPQMDLFGGGVTTSNPIEEIKAEPLKTIDNVNHLYYFIDSDQGHKSLAELMLKEKTVCFDTETTSVEAHNTTLVGMSFSWEKGKAFYVNIPEDQDEVKRILEFYKPFFSSTSVEKVAHNIKFDMEVLKWYGMDVASPIFDTMLAHYLIEPDQRHGMDLLAERLLKYTPISIETLIGKGKKQLSMRDVDFKKVKEYAAEDADVTLQLKEVIEPKLKQQQAEKLFNDIETPLIHVLTDMEVEGIKIDEKALEEYSKQLGKDIIRLEKQIYEEAGTEFNIASPKQLGEVLFEKMEIPYAGKKTKSGQYSTNEETLAKLEKDHSIIQYIMDYRQYNKLKSTYVDALPKLINSKSGRVHSSFNQTVAATGRLSSTNPNLQNIPIRTDKGKEVRKAFIPRDENYTLLAADYSQIELRLVAEVSKDPAMVEAFKRGADIHTATAAKVFHVEESEVTSEMRSRAKTVNFGIIYGISAFGLSQRMGIKRGEAKEIIENYFDKYPGVKASMDNAINFARDKGYVETLLGRRRYLRDINSANATVRGFAERNAINSPLQGTAADMIKIAMIDIHAEFKKLNLKSKMILQVHDELVFDAHKDELEIIKPIIEDKMVNAIKTEVPMTIEMGTGHNWLEAH